MAAAAVQAAVAGDHQPPGPGVADAVALALADAVALALAALGAIERAEPAGTVGRQPAGGSLPK